MVQTACVPKTLDEAVEMNYVSVCTVEPLYTELA